MSLKLGVLEIEEYQNKMMNKFNFNLTIKHQRKKAKKCIKNKEDNDETVVEEEEEIPSFKQYDKLNKYNLSELKKIAKYHKIKPISGNKNQVFKRIFYYYYFSYFAIKIQAYFRRYLVSLCKKMHGLPNTNCINVCDFYTLEPLEDIPWTQRFIFEQQGQKYGCQISSMYRLYKMEKKHLNPYNRLPLSKEIKTQFNQVIHYNYLLNLPIDGLIEDKQERSLAFRLLDFVQVLNSFGHYVEVSWFNELSIEQWQHFLYEFKEIWRYRAGLSSSFKRAIYPPSGLSFSFMRNFNYDSNLVCYQELTLQLFEKLIYGCVDPENKILVSNLILMALTLVSPKFSETFPWLYDGA